LPPGDIVRDISVSILKPAKLPVRTLQFRHAAVSFILFTLFLQRLSEFLHESAIKVVFPVLVVVGLASMVCFAREVLGSNGVLRTAHLSVSLLVGVLFGLQYLVPTGATAAIAAVAGSAFLLLLTNLLIFRYASRGREEQI